MAQHRYLREGGQLLIIPGSITVGRFERKRNVQNEATMYFMRIPRQNCQAFHVSCLISPWQALCKAVNITAPRPRANKDTKIQRRKGLTQAL